MFGSEVLDIALGLVLVFLLMSLILTAVQETIEARLKSRASDLERAVKELLQGNSTLLREFYDHPLIYALHRGERAGAPLSRHELPSYIPRETFAAALIDLFEDGKLAGHQHIEVAFLGLKRLAGDDLNRLRRELEGWYDGAMDRASGWYKRRSQKILFWLGVTISVAMNINSVTLARHLATDQQARVHASALAERMAAENPAPRREDIVALQQQLEQQVGLPIGWSEASRAKIDQLFPDGKLTLSGIDWGSTGIGLLALLTLLAGYLVNGFAVMLGAPFWFDVLNRIMVIRSTVKPKEKSPDEPSEDGGKDQPRPGSGIGAVAGASPIVGLVDDPAVASRPQVDRPSALTTPVYG